MRTYLFIFFAAATVFIYSEGRAQCTVEADVVPTEVVCGDCATLSAFGQGQGLQVFSENFNSGAPTGWAFTQQARFDNPCSPQGVDGTTHIWLGNTSGVPRALETLPYNLSTATSGVTVCFDMLFSVQTGDPATAPCEGPDEPDEGVYLQYSTDGGQNWNTVHYFDPNGGSDPLLTNWNNWCFQLPQAALTDSVQIRWFQDNDSGADYDHWGLDNVVIYFNDPTYDIVWQHDGYAYGQGSSGGVNPNPVCPHQTTDYIVSMSNGTFTCRDTVRVNVVAPSLEVNAGPDIRVCKDECATINATAKVVKRPAKTPTYFNGEVTPIQNALGSTTSININITDLNMTNVLAGSITQVCITGLTFFGFNLFPPAQQTIGDLNIYLVCPDGTKILLIPSGQTTSTTPFDGYTNTCFTPASTNDISAASPPYTGTFMPGEPFDNLAGCTANGVWAIEVSPVTATGIGVGFFNGWSISFNDPEISYTAEYYWNPTTALSDSNSLQPIVCPTQNTNYVLTASDTAGCVTASDTVRITVDVTDLHISAVLTHPACGSNDGAINLSVTNGSGNYTYAWSNGSTAQDLSNIPAGSYSVTVTDLMHCREDTSFALSSANGPAINSISATPETCLGLNNGTASVSASGGTGALSYSWSNGQSGSTITGLAPGNYTVSVSDVLNCLSVATVTVNAGANVIASAQATDESCFNACDGTVTVTASGGNGSFSYQWSDGGPATAGRTGLCAGTYGFTVSDANNCTETGSAEVNSAGALFVDLGGNLNLCEGFSAVLDAGAGYDSYLWSTNETTQAITVSHSGDYSVTVATAGCSASDTVGVTVIPSPEVSIHPDDTTILIGSSVQLHAEVNAGNVNYFWDPIDFLSCTDCPDPVASPPQQGAYSYTVTVFDQQECSGTDSVRITVTPEIITPLVPSAFTPNGDALNNEFYILPSGINVKEFRVYNRWGELIHEGATPWNGTYKGKEQPVGTYTYYAVVILTDGTEQKLSGAFSLLR
ncbi:MAG TPA: gliding motility-associated C-terminal domain-containing protein [Chitinophagales bacterium]|nr:gliding motility-associated C-terminal domain-containing protein [Chitinophagales bacterium]